MAKADEEGTPIFLTASPMGAKLYPKFGFVEIGRLEINLEEFGGEPGEKNIQRE